MELLKPLILKMCLMVIHQHHHKIRTTGGTATITFAPDYVVNKEVKIYGDRWTDNSIKWH